MKRREGSLELEKNLNKTMVVQNSGTRGPGIPGFYCETCNRTYKDSVGYVDHLNGRARTSSPCARLDDTEDPYRSACNGANHTR